MKSLSVVSFLLRLRNGSWDVHFQEIFQEDHTKTDCNDGHLERCDETSLLKLRRRLKLSQSNIKAVMVVPITEVVDVVPLDGILTVLNSSLPCALASAGEICFESGGASIEDTDDVSIISPSLSESLLERVDEFLKWVSLRLASDFHLPQLLVCDVPTEDRLHDVGAIKAIHAIYTDSTSLAVHKLACAW